MPPKASLRGALASKSKSKSTGRVEKRASNSRGGKKTSAPAKATPAPTPTADVPDPATSPSPDPVYFWRPHEGHGYLGQWYPTPFTHNGDTYATAEMWMMVCKARLFGDEEIAQQMLRTESPREHKSLGRKVGGFDAQVWDAEKSRIVEEGNYLKFTISEDAERLRRMLLGTGVRELVEASPRDRIWGIGFGERNAGANRQRWGQNLLGRALMVVRGRLSEEEGKDVKEGDAVEESREQVMGPGEE
ncbi:DUF1768-domain-containing protein [Melanomma pulvis-pyrius CBS 109.77]|uniref:DUF1768-domain-containing protein n=1 Tax=Melanomma pulvis-pyrius CBS 109.77 TaxID=1314802 RepID=A0A6A6XSZ1_9PLEO|nr:DUF1768-domain-containing protein [Melanomma pulvis-pyrius CBS 109.77]